MSFCELQWAPRETPAHLDEVDFDKGRYEQGPRCPADVAGDEDQPREQERAVASRRSDEVAQVLGRDGQSQEREQQGARDEQTGQGPRRRRERHGRRQEGRHPGLVERRAASEASRLVQHTRVLNGRQFVGCVLFPRLYTNGGLDYGKLLSGEIRTRRVESRRLQRDTSPIRFELESSSATRLFGDGRRDYLLLLISCLALEPLTVLHALAFSGPLEDCMSVAIQLPLLSLVP